MRARIVFGGGCGRAGILSVGDDERLRERAAVEEEAHGHAVARRRHRIGLEHELERQPERAIEAGGGRRRCRHRSSDLTLREKRSRPGMLALAARRARVDDVLEPFFAEVLLELSAGRSTGAGLLR